MKPTAKQFEEALNQLLDEYDAFYFENKYGENTHKKQFDTLKQLEGENVTSALLWIMHRYDCHYKEENDHDPVSSPIGYLESLIKAKKEREAMKQKLIDLDETLRLMGFEEEKYQYEESYGYRQAEKFIASQPIIDAISVDWIKEYCSKKAAGDMMDCYWHMFEEDTLKMIEDWRKENATN